MSKATKAPAAVAAIKTFRFVRVGRSEVTGGSNSARRERERRAAEAFATGAAARPGHGALVPKRLGLAAVALVAIFWAMTGAAAATGNVKVCVPTAEGKAIVTPVKGACKSSATLTELATGENDEGKSGLSNEEVATLKSILPHMKFMSSGVGGKPTIQFSGVNVQIVSGAGRTSATVNGEGNLVVGYDENEGKHAQTGSNNLILGEEQTFTSYGGLLAGHHDEILAPFASVSGGEQNIASGQSAAVSGGKANSASGEFDAVGGGYENAASSWVTTVGGGYRNSASGFYSSVSGGKSNAASGEYSSVSGGYSNIADNYVATVSGGFANTANGSYASVCGGGANFASGLISSVSGGENNQASGEEASISGGQFNLASNYGGSVSGGTSNVAEGAQTWIGGGYENVDYEQATNGSVFGGLKEAARNPYEAIP